MLVGLRRAYQALRQEDHPRWWQYPLEPLSPSPINVKYECNASLGKPSIGNCEAALFELVQSGNVVLDPAVGPIIYTAGKSGCFILMYFLTIVINTGNCAIAMDANEKHVTTWAMLRNVIETLLVTCLSGPLSGSIGGTAISQPLPGRGRRQSREKAIFPPTFEVAVYLQEPFNGFADQTCAWGVVSSHEGDVRQCPATAASFRPPERNLGSNITIGENISNAGPLDVLGNLTVDFSAGLLQRLLPRHFR